MQIGTLAEGTKHKTKTAAERAAVRYLEDGYKAGKAGAAARWSKPRPEAPTSPQNAPEDL